ncbi:MAG: prepilin peptidase [Sphingobium phenoxybenzoativorans]
MTPLALPLPIWSLLGGVLGAIVGSFIATCIMRWPQGRSALGGRSACDGCGKTLDPVELFPLLSILVQRGKCRSCSARIDPLHWRVELACAAAGAILLALMPNVAGLGSLILAFFLIPLAILDWRHFWLPDTLTLPLAFLGLTLGQWVTDVTLPGRIIGAAAGYLSLLAISLAYRRLRGREGLGLGDAKLLGALAAWFGWQSLPFLLLIASILALLTVAVSAVMHRSVSMTTRIPLGTFLCLAAVPAWLTVRLMLIPT